MYTFQICPLGGASLHFSGGFFFFFLFSWFSAIFYSYFWPTLLLPTFLSILIAPYFTPPPPPPPPLTHTLSLSGGSGSRQTTGHCSVQSRRIRPQIWCASHRRWRDSERWTHCKGPSSWSQYSHDGISFGWYNRGPRTVLLSGRS